LQFNRKQKLVELNALVAPKPAQDKSAPANKTPPAVSIASLLPIRRHLVRFMVSNRQSRTDPAGDRAAAHQQAR
jgi:hypothetical protein